MSVIDLYHLFSEKYYFTCHGDQARDRGERPWNR